MVAHKDKARAVRQLFKPSYVRAHPAVAEYEPRRSHAGGAAQRVLLRQRLGAAHEQRQQRQRQHVQQVQRHKAPREHQHALPHHGARRAHIYESNDHGDGQKSDDKHIENLFFRQ